MRATARRVAAPAAALWLLWSCAAARGAESWAVDPETGARVAWTQEGTTLVSAAWKGPAVGGKAEGAGVLTVVVRYRGGKENTGRGPAEMKDGALDGKAVLAWSDGQSYDGFWRAGLREGAGRGRTADGVVYEGAWKNDAPSGAGSMAWPDGIVYTGGFKDGLRDGRGTIRLPDGRSYTGEWKAGDPVDRAAYDAALWPRDSIFRISYDAGVDAAVRGKVAQVAAIVARLFARYGITPARPIAVGVTADAEGYVRAINAVRTIPRSEIGSSWGVSLGEKNAIVLRGDEMRGSGLIPVCVTFPHEAFHEAARQFSRVRPASWWIEEGSAEYFRLMAMEEAKGGAVTASADLAKEIIRRAPAIPDTRRLADYTEANRLGREGNHPTYPMALVMVGNLIGGDFRKTVSFYRMRGEGRPEEEAFARAFGVALPVFTDRMNLFFAELRRRR